MNGFSERQGQYNQKIANIISSQPMCIKGFSSYMGDQVEVTTKYKYICKAINFVNYINKDIKDLEFDDLVVYLDEVGRGKTSSYKITIYSALKKFTKYLYASGKINQDYMLSIDRPKATESVKTINKRENAFLNEDEIQKYLAYVEWDLCNDHNNKSENWRMRNKVIIELFLITGIRCSALCDLDVDNYNPESKILIVRDKGSKVSQFKLTDKMHNDLMKWMDYRKQIIQHEETTALFVSQEKHRIHNNTVYAMVKKYGKGIKGKNITPHKFRATYGTQLYKKTNDIYFVQKCMGHSSPSTTEKYIRGNNVDTAKAARIMGDFID